MSLVSSSVAATAHGYVGADLSAVCKEAGLIAMKRLLEGKDLMSAVSEQRPPVTDDFSIRLNDLQDAMRNVRPSAMRSISVDVPKVLWSDIGGMTEVKGKLREAVEWPLKYPEVSAKFLPINHFGDQSHKIFSRKY